MAEAVERANRAAGVSRRAVLAGAGAAGALLSGCCSLRPFAKPAIDAPLPSALPPLLKPTVVKAAGAPAFCVDVHAHFFNASDVPVKGYLEGPVAHSLKEPLRSLVRALAPLADELASIAPTASEEHAELLALAAQPRLKSLADPSTELRALVDRRRAETSRRFYEVVRNEEFERRFNEIQRDKRLRRGSAVRSESVDALDGSSLARAMTQGSRPDLTKSAARYADEATEPHAEGVLAFVGFMLSPRWMNLQVYAEAFSSGPGAFGIDHALGALVDFDRWLDCPPRSAHDDQVRLHQLMSRLSGGYMRPLVAYNPWSDIVDGGRTTERIVDAVRRRGFVGVKIYPPNGFRPYGNVQQPIPLTPGAPSPADLDRALKKFWDMCRELNVPVMAHTGESMGMDDAHDMLGGPPGWSALFDLYQGGRAPLATAAHFGGDGDRWSESLADLMSRPEGATLYADLGYWSDLRCNGADSQACSAALDRLKSALGRQGVAKRLMYGSDWLMLSQERDWARYPHELAAATKGLIPAADLFGLNAKACFAQSLGA